MSIALTFLLSMENPQLGWGFRKAFSFKSVIKTPFDLLKHLAVWQLQKFNKKSKAIFPAIARSVGRITVKLILIPVRYADNKLGESFLQDGIIYSIKYLF